jgi:hypothetical protein
MQGTGAGPNHPVYERFKKGWLSEETPPALCLFHGRLNAVQQKAPLGMANGALALECLSVALSRRTDAPAQCLLVTQSGR